MPAFLGPQSQQEPEAQPPPPATVVRQPPVVVERPKPARSRSSVREAQERVEEVALEMVDARIALARDARDEATRLRAAEGLTAAAGVGVAHTTVNVLVVDMDEALSQLERLQLQRGESVDVASREVEG